ncbi:cytochrome P450 [Xylariaceae sp. FL1019]|nr:cytochrome P450 [Xylariaceae sp. FL1019]
MAKLALSRVFIFSATISYALARVDNSTYLQSFSRISALCFTLWVLVKVFIYPNLVSPLRQIPTVDGGKWWSRSSLRLYTEPRGHAQADWALTTPTEQHGLVRYRTLFNAERIIVTHPDSLAEVLTTKAYQFKKPEAVVTGLRQVLGMGILLVEGDVHKAQRKTLLPAFSFRHIKQLYSPMWDISSHALCSLTKATADNASKASNAALTVDISDWASSATLDIMCVLGLGQDRESVLNKDETYATLRRTYRQVTQQERADVVLFFLRIWILPAWALPFIPVKRSQVLTQAAATLRSVCRQFIRQKKLDIENGIADKAERDILTVALSHGGFGDAELVDQLLTFLAAGHETTATALTWAIYALCVHQEMQTRLRDEIRASLPSPSSPLPMHDCEGLATTIDKQMPYLSAVCQEVLRFFAPVPTTFREAAVNTSIQGVQIPAGTQIVISPRATNRDERLWGKDAKVFNPDRHLSLQQQTHYDPLDHDTHEAHSSTTSEQRSNYANLTFLHGPRSCIGQSFARAEMAILLAQLVGRFRFQLADPSQAEWESIKLRRGSTLRPANGMHVKVELVEGWGCL